MFGRELRDAVRRERSRGRALGRGIPLGLAVNRRRRREDDADALPRGGFEDAAARLDVAAEVEREHVTEAADARLAGEVEDAVEAGEIELVLGEVDATHVERARVLLGER